MRNKNITTIGMFHYFRLVFRSLLLGFLLISYLLKFINIKLKIVSLIESNELIVLVIWFVFIIEMIMRFFPSKLESPGCQKQFKDNYIKTGNTKIKIQDNNASFLVAVIWILFNLIFWELHTLNIVDDDFMLILSCMFSVCDMICILFFCPFQTWFLKNKCCVSCRIYNWDYAMMFTPLMVINNFYAQSLVWLSLFLLFRWEWNVFRNPERFSENTNAYLHCENCSEKLCVHKKQLMKLKKDIEQFYKERTEKLQIFDKLDFKQEKKHEN